jgi:hypothetical protein
MHRSFPARPLSPRVGLFGTLILSLAAACSGNERGAAVLDGGALNDNDGGSASEGEGDGANSGNGGGTRDGGNPLSVGADSELCDEPSLPLRPAGCECKPGEKVGCWTGKPGDRLRGECHDGVQTCEGTGEFGTWGPCEDEQQDCGEGDAGPAPDDCLCVPGTIITCSEDCSELIICSLTGTKVCQPDGTWSRYREGNLDNLANTNLCRNVFFGCLSQNFGGVFLGACDDAFTCGHPPGLFPPAPPESPGDAGTPADAGGPSIQ